MPWGWIIFKTPPAEHNPSRTSAYDLPTDPEELEEFVRQLVKNAGGEFIALYFETGPANCHVIVRNLDNAQKAQAVTSILHATAYKRLLDPKQAKGSRRLADQFRKAPRGKPPSPRRRPKTR